MSSNFFAQTNEWQFFTNGDKVTYIVPHKDILWVGTNGGLVKYNPSTNETEFFNIGNAGLKYNPVYGLAIDKEEVIWVKTYPTGISSFDGKEWKIYDETNTGISFSSYWGSPIAVDSNNVKWIGGINNKLIRYDGNSWEVLDSTNSPLPNEFLILEIMIDSNNKSWIATHYNGIYTYDGNNWGYYNNGIDGFIGREVWHFYEDSKNNIWATVEYNGVSKFDGNKWANYSSDLMGIGGADVSAISEDSFGNMWFAGSVTLVSYDGTNFSRYKFDKCRNFSWSLVIDENNNKWIGNNGLLKFNNNNWRKINTSNSLLTGEPNIWNNANQITNIFVDENNKLWITSGGGITTYDGEEWSQIKNEENDVTRDSPFNYTTMDENNNLWILSNKSIIKYDGNNWKKIEVPEQYNNPFSRPEKILIDKNNVLWIKMWNRGMLLFNPNATSNNWYLINPDNSDLVESYIVDYIEDKQRNVWLATPHSISKVELDHEFPYTNSKWTTFSDSIGNIPLTNISSLTQNNRGEVWASSYSKELAYYTNNNWIKYEIPDLDFSFSKIYDIKIDEYNFKWLTTDEGLVKFRNSDWSIYNINDYQNKHDWMRKILIDNENNKWIYGGYWASGLAKFNEGETNNNIIQDDLISDFVLLQNYPNPFNGFTTVPLFLNRTVYLSIAVFDILGNKVQKVFNGTMEAGSNEIKIEFKNKSSGVYFYKVESDNFIDVKKLVYLK